MRNGGCISSRRRPGYARLVFALRDRGADCFHFSEALYAAARFSVGSEDRLLAVFSSAVRDSTLPSLANSYIS